MAIGNIIVVGNSPFHQGGAGPWAHNTLNALSSAGYRVRAIFPIYPGKADWRGMFRQSYPNVQAAWYPMPSVGNPFHDISVEELKRQGTGILAELETFLHDGMPDLLYLTKESVVWKTPQFARSRGLRCLATLHGNLLSMVRANGHGYRPRAWIEAYRQTELVTSCAAHMTESLRSIGLDNIVTLRNGVDVERFFPLPRPIDLAHELGIAAKDTVLLHASNLHPIKRPLDLVRAFAQALGRDKSLRLVIVGDGDMRTTLERESEDLGIDQYIRFVGWVENTDMSDYYALADFTVLPSASEGLSMACLESMACGRFVVASDIPASSELIDDRVDGFLFPVGDIDRLAETILAAASAARRGLLGKAVREKIERDFSLSHMQRRQLEIVGRFV